MFVFCLFVCLFVCYVCLFVCLFVMFVKTCYVCLFVCLLPHFELIGNRAFTQADQFFIFGYSFYSKSACSYL